MLFFEVQFQAFKTVFQHCTDLVEKLLAEANKLVDASTPGNISDQELDALVQRKIARSLASFAGGEVTQGRSDAFRLAQAFDGNAVNCWQMTVRAAQAYGSGN